MSKKTAKEIFKTFPDAYWVDKRKICVCYIEYGQCANLPENERWLDDKLRPLLATFPNLVAFRGNGVCGDGFPAYPVYLSW